ncbi:NYN domain-containing protein [Cryobacterium sp. Y29]|uniref:NYN domain-containing protein n=1 Tax=Cryobacterium sp. Y29 TaxID=2048285 RepID=UPI000CE2C7F3|nr:NYN domain-containing protein [Cryobacterium sp. Y29]
MTSRTHRRNVAVFIDLENMFGGYNNNVSGVPLSRMLREIRKFVEDLEIGSSAATTRAYANWMVAGMSTYRREMLENAVEPVQIFSYEGKRKNLDEGRRKNAADVQIVVDALSVAVEAPWVDVFVIVSGDGDFIPLVRRLQYLGKYVIGATLTGAGAGGVSAALRSNADHYFEVEASLSTIVTKKYPSSIKTPIDSSKESTSPRLPSDRIPELDEYVMSVKEIVSHNPQMMRGDEVSGALLGNILRTEWPRVNFSTYGFKSLGDFIDNECGLKIYRPTSVKNASSSKSAPADTGKSSVPAPVAVTDLSELRLSLQAVEPAVIYPDLTSLISVLEELTVRFSPLEPDDLLDALGDDLPDVPAEQIRLALGLLFAVGAFRADESALMLTSDVAGVEDGISLVLDDARRRAETIELIPTDEQIREAVFGPNEFLDAADDQDPTVGESS